MTITVTLGSIETQGKQKQKKKKKRDCGKEKQRNNFDSLEYILAFRVYPQPAYWFTIHDKMDSCLHTDQSNYTGILVKSQAEFGDMDRAILV